MDLYYKQEVSVGLLVLVAIVGFFAGLMWLTGQSFRSSQVDVIVQFSDVGTLSVGDPVQVSGVRIGRVAGARLEEEGAVMVTLEVNDRFRPRVDASVAIRSLDFLGAKYIKYSPGQSDTFLPDGDVLTGTISSDIADAAVGLTDDAAGVMIGLQRVLSEQMAQDVTATLAATRSALGAIAQAGEGPLIENAQSAFGALERLAVRLDSTLANPGLNESLDQLDELTENVSEMAEGLAGATMALGAMLRQMADSSGSIGKLMNEDTIHEDLHNLMTSLTQLLDDIRERPGRYTFVSVF